MLHVRCEGLPYEIGTQHGQQASEQVHGSIEFYKALFAELGKTQWHQVCEHALKFLPYLQSKESAYVEEMQGLSQGASVPFASILALNVRTELAYGMFEFDGCTALSWHDEQQAILAQNWDWRPAQKPNLIHLSIVRKGHTISMITEAGIIGKIGINSAGFGVCLNAIRVRGVSFQKLPVHLALRKALDYDRTNDIDGLAELLETAGIASAAHILVACDSGATGLESTFKTVKLLRAKKARFGSFITHTNHLTVPHRDMDVHPELTDSPVRLDRIDALIGAESNRLSSAKVFEMLKDEQGHPGSICRAAAGSSKSATLFSIVMDLKARRARVKLGRPTENGEELELDAIVEAE